MRNYNLFAIILILSVLSMTFVSAEILISQPKSIYSVGDDFSFSVTLSAQTDSFDSLVISLNCESDKKEIYRDIIELSVGEQEKVEKTIPLSRSFLGAMQGKCKIMVEYNGDVKVGQEFTISDELKIKGD